jgi:putative transposase
MCYPLTITNNYSRMILGWYALPSTKGEPVKECFEETFCRWGIPEAIGSDNGAPLASRAPGGLSWLSDRWVSLGIHHERIEPVKSQQNGRHEPMHLTLKQQTAHPAEATMGDQQTRFDEFVTFFNELRPHEALAESVPSSSHVVASRP